VRVFSTAIMLELRIFKYGESGSSPRVPLLIPTTGDDEPFRRLFLRLLGCTPESAAAPWFNQPDLVAATAAGLCGVAARPHPGARFAPRSLRSCGIIAAYAVGVPLERKMELSNHASAAVVMRHYLDPLMPPTQAARVFFQRFVPSSLSLSASLLRRFRLLLALRGQPRPLHSYALVSGMTLYCAVVLNAPALCDIVACGAGARRRLLTRGSQPLLARPPFPTSADCPAALLAANGFFQV
jgi:hypothetical protein